MSPPFLLIGASCALTGVAFGAFGAHGLKTVLSPEMLSVYQTGVTYQMWHALGLLFIALLNRQQPNALWLCWSGWLMLAGIVLFSGSLYLLAMLNLRWLGMITPLGGLCFLSAWLSLAIYAARNPGNSCQ